MPRRPSRREARISGAAAVEHGRTANRPAIYRHSPPPPKQQGRLSVQDVTIDDGLRHHAVLLVPVNTRLDHGVDVEVANNEDA